VEVQNTTLDWRFYFQLITLFIAVIGAGLGIYNTWFKNRIKIKVKINYGITPTIP
jgi:hypothetical protein